MLPNHSVAQPQIGVLQHFGADQAKHAELGQLAAMQQ